MCQCNSHLRDSDGCISSADTVFESCDIGWRYGGGWHEDSTVMRNQVDNFRCDWWGTLLDGRVRSGFSGCMCDWWTGGGGDSDLESSDEEIELNGELWLSVCGDMDLVGVWISGWLIHQYEIGWGQALALWQISKFDVWYNEFWSFCNLDWLVIYGC